MIKYNKGDVYLSDLHTITFNPVGVRCSTGFYKRIKYLYPEVYNMYEEKVWMYSARELLGEIQLVYTDNDTFILNAFCLDRHGRINKLALCKTLIELCNLSNEYKVTVGIEYALGVKKKSERKLITTIIDTIFSDSSMDTYLYERQKGRSH